jgi:hypothetical protein
MDSAENENVTLSHFLSTAPSFLRPALPDNKDGHEVKGGGEELKKTSNSVNIQKLM